MKKSLLKLCLKYQTLLAGYIGSIDEYARAYNLQQANKLSQSQPEAEKAETVVVYTQNLVSGELTEQLMK